MATTDIGRELTEEELYSPDIDEGELDVESYPVPSGDGIEDPYLREVWNEAVRSIEENNVEGEDQ